MPVKITMLMWLYLLFAIAGAIVPWYYNIQYMQESRKLLTLTAYFSAGTASPLATSVTTDFFIGTTPVLVWMCREGKRKGIKYLWFFIPATFLISFAFACPLFLFIREYTLINNNNRQGDHTN